MSDDDTALDDTLRELRRCDEGDLIEMSTAIDRMVIGADEESPRVYVLGWLRMIPLMLSFSGVSPDACNFHLSVVVSELRTRDAVLLDKISTEITMHAVTLMRVSSRLSHGMILLSRVLHVIAHEKRS